MEKVTIDLAAMSEDMTKHSQRNANQLWGGFRRVECGRWRPRGRVRGGGTEWVMTSSRVGVSFFIGSNEYPDLHFGPNQDDLEPPHNTSRKRINIKYSY